MSKTKKISRTAALIGGLAAAALIFSYVEALIPSVAIPGIKLGLANAATVILLYYLDAPTAFSVSAIRILLSSLLFGSALSWVYAVSGGILSFLGMYLLKRVRCFSVLGVSISGGILHNLGQLAAASILFDYPLYVTLYLPILLIAGTAAGALVGFTAVFVLRRLPNKNHLG